MAGDPKSGGPYATLPILSTGLAQCFASPARRAACYGGGMIRAKTCRPSGLLLLAPLLALSACATGQYPSLARRDAERITRSAEVAPPPAEPAPAPPPPGAGFTTRIAQLVAQAQGAHGRFAARRAATERAIGAAGGAAVASESWSVATVALSGLESARSEAMLALAQLDELYATEAVAGTEAGDMRKAEAAGAAREQVTALIAEEDAVLARLRGRLRG